MNQEIQISDRQQNINDQKEAYFKKSDERVYHSLKTNKNIDQQKLPTLTSDQYLKNYTYLQFSLFPELFDVYLNKLSLNELKDQLCSYVSILLEFLQDSAIYERFTQTNLAHEVLLKYNGDENQQIQSKIKSLADKLLLLSDKLVKSRTNLQDLKQFVDQLDFTEINLSIYQNILISISKKPLTQQLFNFICQIIQKLVQTNGSHTLYDILIPSYIYRLSLGKLIFRKYNQLQIINNLNIQNPQKYLYCKVILLQIMKLRIIPFQLELNHFYQHIKSSQTKQFYLIKLFYSQSCVQWYWTLLGFIYKVDLITQMFFDQDQPKKTDVNKSSSKSLKFTQLFILIKNIAGSDISAYLQEEPSLERIICDGQNNTQTCFKQPVLKQFGTQSFQRLSRIITRIQKIKYSDGNQMEIQLFQGSKTKQLVIRTVQIDGQTCTMKKDVSSLSEGFLIPYCSLISRIQTQMRLNKANLQTHHQLNNPFLNQLKNILQVNNKSIYQILTIPHSNLTYFRDRISSALTQVNLILQLMTLIIQAIQGLKQAGNDGQDQINKNYMIYKVKSSAFINILTLRIVEARFGYQVCQAGNSCGAWMKIERVSDIGQLFDEIFDCVAFQYINGSGVEQKTQAVGVNNYPFLENILYLFSSVQLWFQFSDKNQQQKMQIQGFFQIAIRKYSHQGIKIDKEQIIYVNYIIEMCQIFKQIKYPNKQKQTQNISQEQIVKIKERVQKLIQLGRQNNQLSIKFQNLINSIWNIQKYLEILTIRLLSICFPSTKITGQTQNGQKNINKDADKKIQPTQIIPNQEQQSTKFDQKNYKFSFWKSLFLKNKSLNHQVIVTYFIQNIFKRRKIIQNSQDFCQNQAVNLENSVMTFSAPLKVMEQISQEEMDEAIQLFILLKQKYRKMSSLKRKLKGTYDAGWNSDGVKDYALFQNNFEKDLSEDTFMFLLDLIADSIQNFMLFAQIHQRSPALTSTHQQISTKISNSINHRIKDLTQSTITPKTCLLKPSPTQTTNYLTLSKKDLSQQTKQKLNQKIKQIHQYLDRVIQFSLLNLSLLFWMRCQNLIKININSGRVRGQQGTVGMVRWVVLLGLIQSVEFRVNFEHLQENMWSNVDGVVDSQVQGGLLETYRFPQISIKDPLIKSELSCLADNQFLEFAYEYIPFQINSYTQQLELLNFSKQFTLKEQNHQFIGAQKQQKIKFNRTCQYLELLSKIYL